MSFRATAVVVAVVAVSLLGLTAGATPNLGTIACIANLTEASGDIIAAGVDIADALKYCGKKHYNGTRCPMEFADAKMRLGHAGQDVTNAQSACSNEGAACKAALGKAASDLGKAAGDVAKAEGKCEDHHEKKFACIIDMGEATANIARVVASADKAVKACKKGAFNATTF
jgi:hypothetical protein